MVQCSPALVAPSRYVSELMEFSLALGAPAFEKHYRRFLDDPRGQRLLRERPDLPAVLGDRDALAACAGDSFARAYVDFTSRYRFDASAFEAAHDIDGMAQRLGWDDDFAYLITRGLQTHDLWHTLAGYGPDWAGEAGVMAFTYGQIPNAGVGIVAGILAAISGDVPRKRWNRFVKQAWRRGRSADYLLVAPYEDLLPRPIDDVRRELGIAPLTVAHPEGLPYTSFRYGFAKAMSTGYDVPSPADQRVRSAA